MKEVDSAGGRPGGCGGPGRGSVAVPVGTSRDGSVVVALSITMPSSRTDDTWPDSLVEPLTRAANAMKPYVIAS
jgi:DNA-binding IclR family transcriptional regulator